MASLAMAVSSDWRIGFRASGVDRKTDEERVCCVSESVPILAIESSHMDSERPVVPEGIEFLTFVADFEDKCETETLERIIKMGKKAPE
jgi:uncharacterized Fe-S radical SAM superfamily protein PflX